MLQQINREDFIKKRESQKSFLSIFIYYTNLTYKIVQTILYV